jgi:hypothetical protein
VDVGERQRRAAQVEEGGLRVELGQLQHLAPHPGDHRLGVAPRRQPLRAGGGAARRLRRRQRLAVELAGRRQRPALHRHPGGRHHVLGEPRRGERGERVGVGRRRRVGRPQVGDQPAVARRVLARHHHRLGDRRVLAEDGLDLAQLDAEAAHLDLGVEAAEELDQAVAR